MAKEKKREFKERELMDRQKQRERERSQQKKKKKEKKSRRGSVWGSDDERTEEDVQSESEQNEWEMRRSSGGVGSRRGSVTSPRSMKDDKKKRTKGRPIDKEEEWERERERLRQKIRGGNSFLPSSYLPASPLNVKDMGTKITKLIDI